ncbi:glycosyltransferase [Streptomyces sp. A7024]|uniref:Glycosyltransferase n=1 Tax=Streptomyces coryli TaxID=1128680 RepID=A0A6G4U8E7_9ACTN|nr:glycosyltransferase family 2 protein [Streptomyces coryli]NGN68393.1 glycosyltransferase [Streptomyces coryli]
MSTPNAAPPAGESAAAPELPQHVVTAVLVSHDGERWLPDVLAGIAAQQRPVQNVIAADTGSADGSARILAESLGAERILHLARRTSFGAAVDEAARTAGPLGPDQLPYLRRPSGWDPVTRTWHDEAYDMPELPYGEPVQWLWLLHDDAAPEPGTLQNLLRVAAATPSATVVGPKLRGWYDRRQLLETGVSIANSGRRWTGIDRREQDQGQHDGVRDVLSVSTAGMLIRRDVYEQLGGFDQRLPLMRDDVDLCWRARQAGHRVLIAPDAVMRHAEAAARERRSIDCIGRGRAKGASPHRVDKAGAAYALLANSPAGKLPWIAFRLILGTLLRTIAYLVGKVPRQALDEIAGLGSVLLRPHRIISARRRRGRPNVPPSELKPLFPRRGATVRVTFEQVLSNFSGKAEEDRSGGGRHGAVETGPGDDEADFLEVEQFARVKRVARKPGPVLFAVLLLASLIACRALLGGGSLMGGALLPAPDGAGELWSRYVDAWHPLGVGGTEAAPPYLAVLASLATVLFGSTNFALTLLLVCSVPLAGLTAYFASRPLLPSRLLRAWGSVAYAFLPATTGALAGGRLGTCVLAILLPLIARVAVAASGLRRESARPAWRPAWAYALLLTITTAFTPVVWPIALVLAAAVLGFRAATGRGQLGAYGLRLLAALATPMVVLAPWSLQLLGSPSRFFGEAGLDRAVPDVSATDLLLAAPGGPNGAGGILLVGVLLAALAALLRGDRELAVRTAWAAAAAGFLFAALGAGEAWAGPASLVYGTALLAAAVLGADGARHRVAEQSFGWRQPVAVLIAAACAIGPLLLAAGWMASGADGPLERRDPAQVPAFVAEEANTADQPRTLVLDGTPGEVGYTLVRGSGARLGDAELAESAGQNDRLSAAVANLVAGSGADQTAALGDYAVRYVLVRQDAVREFGRVLDTTTGLTKLSDQNGSALWRIDRKVSRVTITGGKPGPGQEAGAAVAPAAVPAGPVDVHTDIKGGPDGRVLRLADSFDGGWQATLDGKALKPVKADGWAQGFELPASGGRLDVTYDTPVSHTGWVWAQAGMALVVLVLALPGRRREIDDDLPEVAAPAPVPAEPVAGEGRRARRLRAAAAAQPGGDGEQVPAAPEHAPQPEPAAVPQQPDYAAWDSAGYADPYGAQQQPDYGQGGTGYDYDPGYYTQPSAEYAQPEQGQAYAHPEPDQAAYDFQAFGTSGDGTTDGSDQQR